MIDAYDQPFGNSSAVPAYHCALLAREHGVFIHGQHLASQSSSKIGVVNPANGEVLANVHSANSDDLDAAVAAGSTMVRVGRAIFGNRPKG